MFKSASKFSRTVSAAAVALVFAANPPAFSATTDITGPAKVIDGDTIKINNTRIRIHGIDAPENKQTCMMPKNKTIRCGVIASDAMRDLVTGATVICKQQDIDRYGRVVAICYVDGHDVGQKLMHAGWALAYRRYSKKYVAIEGKARAAKRGMWRGSFVKPWEWRRGKRLSSARPPSATDCLIKGNISKSGKIYHKPGSRWYEATGIDLGKGERWFCSVADAVRAGWRAPN
jgi:endonuclease YncB( thermonuclease family)